jgi:phosphotriesterase-related protein
LAHLETGLTLAVHTGSNPQAVYAQLALLKQYGINPREWIWVHANQSTSDELLMEVAALGGWISLDGVKKDNLEITYRRLLMFKERDLLSHVLLSHDGNGYPGGRSIRRFDAILSDLIPFLLQHEFSQDEVDLLLNENPARAFGI